ncbi:MAG: lactate utilization protein [Pseudomonadota bacterium]
MGARAAILSKIRRSLGVDGTETDRRAVAADRLQRAPRGLVPKRGAGSASEQKALFMKMAEAVQASVVTVPSRQAVPEAVADYLRGRNLPPSLKTGADPRITALPFEANTPTLEVRHGPSDGQDPVGLSYAFAGIAETGTLVLHSGPDNPTTLNFLPDTHVVVVDAQDIDGDYETAWTRLRDTFGKGVMPRTVNMITGPSRSGDIEQTLLLGAHGPRDLHIIVVEGAGTSGESA